jgi:hypothetical protein
MDLRYLGGWALLLSAAFSLLFATWISLIGGSPDAAPGDRAGRRACLPSRPWWPQWRDCSRASSSG